MSAPTEGGAAEPAASFSWDLEGLPVGPAPEIPDHDLLDHLGEGGMGLVYRARHRTLGREVAVKVLPIDRMTELARKRFHREAQLLARFRHPNVLAVHSTGETPRTCYLISELVHGRHFDAVCAESSLDRRLDLIEDLANAVSALHEEGIVHRDLKPSNVLVTEDGTLKVIDFGVSTGEGVSRLTSTGKFVGTPLYAAPERFGGQHGDAPPCDVWSLGVMAYEALAGAHPFDVSDRINLTGFSARMQMPVVPLNERNPQVTAAVAAAVARAMQPSRKQRTPDARAFAEDLRAARAASPESSSAGALVIVGLLGVAALGAALAALPRPPAAAPDPAPPAPIASAEPVSSAAVDSGSERTNALRELARQRRWAALREGLQAPGAPSLPRLRGLATLYLEGPDAARGQLSAGDPALLHELALRDARGTLAARGTLLSGILSYTGALQDAVRACPEDDPARAEAGARSVSWLLDALRVAAESPERMGPSLGKEQLVMAKDALAPFVSDPTPLRLGILLALHGRGLQRPKGRRSLALIHDEFPVEGYVGPEEALVAQLRFVVSMTTKGRPQAAELAPAAREALEEPPRAAGVYQHIARRCHGELAMLDRDEGVARMRRGEESEGTARLQRALQHARAMSSLAPSAPFADYERLVQASVALAAGSPDEARAALEKIPNRTKARLGRDYLLLECELVSGRLDDARDRIQRIRPRDLPPLWRRALALQKIHRVVLNGRVTPEEGLRRIEGAFGVRKPTAFAPVEWHTKAGLRSVLQGGWWPGKPKGR